MAIHVQSFHIERFRGIKSLSVSELNHVNLIVGDNNCGKTSVLEALLILRNPGDLTNVLRIARQRELQVNVNRTSAYESLMNLLSKGDEQDIIRIATKCKEKEIVCAIEGVRKKILLDENEIRRSAYYLLGYKRGFIPAEVEAYVGTYECIIGAQKSVSEINFHEQSRITGLEVKRNYFMNMVYLSPSDHLRGNIISNIVRSDGYKEICLRVIQMFDPDIEDLLLLRNEQTNRPVDYIKHRIVGNMPISTYGDGVKKVLLLANAIAQAADGVLMIDEIETAIHAKYYSDVFQFLIKACKQYNVQLFITTHNLETVDALLATQSYGKRSGDDDITVLTLKKEHANTYSRSLSGRTVYENRESFDFEVRL